MSAPLSRELRTKYTVCSLPHPSPQTSAQALLTPLSHLTSRLSRRGAADREAHSCLMQVGAVPVRKDDEVTVVRGTYKVNSPCPGRLRRYCSAGVPATQQQLTDSRGCREGKGKSCKCTGKSGSSTLSASPGRRSMVRTTTQSSLVATAIWVAHALPTQHYAVP